MAKMILTNGFYVAEKASYHWITNGRQSFQDNKNITFWFADLPNLTDGYSMFHSCYNLISFEGDLSALTNGEQMFRDCPNLRSFEGDLSALTNGTHMFSKCKITEWNTTLPNLTDGDGMFQSCTNLTSFEGDLPKLTNGQNVFYGCKSLTSFSSDLPKLTNGSGMFGKTTSNCTKLDLTSVQRIANTINDLTAAGTTGTIHIGMASALQSDDETAPINVALAAIRAKGWTVNELYRS